ncbi:unnamed protein product [Dicrocoelium dendriticum]|nr:unnamed protein product [Dicrocoelium dendriticum]
MKKYLKTEWTALVTSVAKCALRKRLEKLDSKRESLLHQLANSRNRDSLHEKDSSNSSVCQSSIELLNALRETEKSLIELRSLPEIPSKWLTDALISAAVCGKKRNGTVSKLDKNVAWERRIFHRYHGPKFVREYTVQTWLNILSTAEEVLTRSDWTEISNLAVSLLSFLLWD